MIGLLRGEAPEGLDEQKPGSYGLPAVRRALERDFHGKCYLCESPRRSAQVEHLRPQKGFPELRAAWSNLFLACGGSCNQRRIRWSTRANAHERDGMAVDWPEEGMLDPAVDAVETRIRQQLVRIHDGRWTVHFEAEDPSDGPAVNTAEELQRIHEERQGEEICDRIRDWNTQVQRDLSAFLVAREVEADARVALLRLKAKLSDAAPYAGLMRSELRDQLRSAPHLLTALGLGPVVPQESP